MTRVVIDIPEDVYMRLKAGDTNAGNTFHNTALNSIKNGTPMYKNCSECAYQDTPCYFCRDCQILIHRNFKEKTNETDN